VVTNGFLLSRHPELPLALSQLVRRSILEVSSHRGGRDFQARFAKVRTIVGQWVAEFGIDVRIFESDKKGWRTGQDSNSRPPDS
jgi:hypothetical protein